MNRGVSIIIPVIRPEKAKRCVDAIRANGFYGPILVEKDTDRIGCPEMVKKLAERTSGQIVCFLGDDTIPHPGWLEAGLKKMAELPDGWGAVGLLTQGSVPQAHWLADKRMLPLLGGEFFCTEYRHNFCDNELMDIAQENGRWTTTDEIVLDHDHPVNTGKVDASYQYDDFEDDRKVYVRRKRERLGGLAIGFPLVDKDVPVQFFTSFACMHKPEQYTLLLPKFVHGAWTGSIADARNSLVEQAQMAGAKWFLMCDTDQVYPPDMLVKLLSHRVDICGVRVHRRWPPFDPIFYRGTMGEYLNVADEEMYSGELIEVDATGTGCLLFDMEVFDRVPPPWFQFTMHNGRPVGEDIGFCSKARELGVRIFIDTSIMVGHLTTMEVGEMMHKLCRKMQFKET